MVFPRCNPTPARRRSALHLFHLSTRREGCAFCWKLKRSSGVICRHSTVFVERERRNYMYPLISCAIILAKHLFSPFPLSIICGLKTLEGKKLSRVSRHVSVPFIFIILSRCYRIFKICLIFCPSSIESFDGAFLSDESFYNILAKGTACDTRADDINVGCRGTIASGDRIDLRGWRT